MKIAIVSNRFSSAEGGATTIAFQQAKLLAELGHQVFVFAGGADKKSGWSTEQGLKVYRLVTPDLPWLMRSYFCLRNKRVEKEFEKFLAEVNPTVIHFHNLYYQLPFSLFKIAKEHTAKVFFTVHDVMTFSQVKLDHFVDKKYSLANIDEVNYRLPIWIQLWQNKKAYNPWRNLIIRHYLKYVAKIFSVSDELKKALAQNKIKNITTLHNGIDVTDWQADETTVAVLQKKLGLINKKVILFAGRLSGYKGTKQIMLALAQVIKEIPEAILLVLDSKNNYHSENPAVILAGAVPHDQIKNYYALSDVVVVPSICFDSFPTINLEAMACRKPVIATIFGGSRELVEDQKTGYLINPLRIDELTEKIIYLLNNPAITRAMGESGYQKVKTEFNQVKWIKEILRWY